MARFAGVMHRRRAAMNLWQSLVLACVGGALALIGTWMGFHFQAREQRRGRSDQLTRDGLLRLHTDRVTSYTAFYSAGGSMRAILLRLVKTADDDDLKAKAWEQRSSLWDACASVTLVGSREAAVTAWDLLNYATDVLSGKTTINMPRYARLIWGFVYAARLDLAFPDSPGTLPTAVWLFQGSETQVVGETAGAAEAE
jgi:hypothetical protein